MRKLRAWSSGVASVTPIARIDPTWPCCFAGVIQSVRIDPRDRSVEAFINDGTGCITARWTDRTSFSDLHVTPGMGFIATGLPTVGDKKQLMMNEPSYEVVPGPQGG
ncbi:MAG: hypothetical protein H0W21_00790 [Actinobacteria bacterium]|nr:hypothetical protein [Actinomycetota bacterium]